ncbi:tyrosine-type recombinase/integrase [Algicola sagamiensis]|uniref:tyrosine-type recombinase/integrase n=1 Tax=Algicola sagamiensis TaxID=163869 RepID=UPI000374E483|nr:site-specific integrase [Algicola sagamiensis]
MSRKLFYRDEKRGVYLGQFPPPGGWKAGRKGVRRVLCRIEDISHFSLDEQTKFLINLYEQKQWEIKNAEQLVELERKQKKKEKKCMTMKAAAKLWLEEVEELKSQRTYQSYSSTISYYFQCTEDHPLKHFDRDKNIDFYKFLEKEARYRNKPLSKSTQNYHMRQLQVFLTWAHDNEMIEKPIKLKKAKKPKPDMETYSVEHLQQLKNHIQTQLKTEQRPRELLNLQNLMRAFVMATNTLMRIGAIDAMKIEWIDMKRRVIRVRDNPERGFTNKGMKHPNKPINDELYKFLKEDLKHRKPGEVYFLDNGKGKPWYADRSGPSKYASKQCRKCGLPPIKPYHWGMRASMITWLLNNGATITDVQELADHENIETTISYFNTRTAKQKSAVDALPKI